MTTKTGGSPAGTVSQAHTRRHHSLLDAEEVRRETGSVSSGRDGRTAPDVLATQTHPPPAMSAVQPVRKSFTAQVLVMESLPSCRGTRSSPHTTAKLVLLPQLGCL